MERPAKRQRLSQGPVFPIPTRTLDLTNLQRPHVQRRAPGKVILPRAPDVTVTAGVLEVAVNDDSPATQIALPTVDVAVSLGSLGTLTVPAMSVSTSASSQPEPESESEPASDSSSASKSASASASDSSRSSETSTPGISSSSQPSSSSVQSLTVSSSNSTVISTSFTSQKTITVTETSTFHVSYDNGTFIAPTSTRKSSKTGSNSDDEDTSTTSSRFASSSSSKYVFGQDFTDTYTSSTSTTDAGYSNAVVGATATNAGSAATSSGSSGSGSGDGNDNSGSSGPVLSPQQTQLVGGVVGGAAGIALVLVIVLYVLRWYRQRLKQQGRLPEQLNSGHSRGGSGLIGAAAPMSDALRPHFFPPAAIASGMKKWRPTSDMTMLTNTTSTTGGADSEKGFQRVSGRKIPPVLTTGGDQFGGSYGAFEKEMNPPVPATHHNRDLSESSFYRDAEGTYIGDGRPTSQSHSVPSTPVYPSIFSAESASARRPSLANTNTKTTDRRDFANDDFNTAFYRNMNMNMASPRSKPDGVAVFRSSPARTPVTQSPNTSSIRLPIQAPVTMDEDIPEMPLPSPGIGLGHNLGLAGQRVPSRLSERTVGIGNGRFREEIA